jgi:hypothetical protein
MAHVSWHYAATTGCRSFRKSLPKVASGSRFWKSLPEVAKNHTVAI